MKNKKIISFFLGIMALSSCQKRATGFFSQVSIHYVDQSGKDLFTNGQNGYFLDSVRVYGIRNGRNVIISTFNSMYPNGFTPNVLYPYSGISVTPNDSDIVNRYTISIIHLKKGVDDTLKIHLNQDSQMGAIYDQILYNGVLVKDTVTIIKR